MASFTDQIMQFNPYVQQLPVEAMKEVGMYKQQKYDEGIQKIQGYIDNIAGLPILRDVDKRYVQSKLNELGNNLRKVAAADFSNFQIVNSVGGMANQIMKDKRVQNAVSSAARYQKALTERDAFVKEGKTSPSNDVDFNREANDWLNSDDIDKTYNGSYNPYTNVRKNSVEIMKALTGNKTITDDSFKIITDPQTGKTSLEIYDATLRTQIAGIPPERIQQALLTGLSPADWKQLEIDGRYTYANRTGEQFSRDLFSSYTDRINDFVDKKKQLEAAKTTTKDANEIGQLDDKIGEIDKTLSGLVKQYDRIGGMLKEGNVEGAKAQLYTTDFLSGFSSAFAYTEISKTQEPSQYALMEMRKQEKEQQWLMFKIREEREAREFQQNYLQREREIEATKKKETGTESPYGPLGTGLKETDVPQVSLGTAMNKTEELDNQIKADQNAFTEQFLRGKTVFDPAINKERPMTDAEKRQWLADQRIRWMKSPNGVDPMVSKHFYETDELARRSSDNKEMIKQVTAMADAKYQTIDKLIPKNAPSYNYSSPSLNTTFTPMDFVNYNTKKLDFITFPKSAGGAPALPVYDLDRAREKMTAKEYRLFEIENNVNRKGMAPFRDATSGLSKGDKVLYDVAQDYGQKIVGPYRSIFKEKETFINGEITRRSTVYEAKETTLPSTTQAEKDGLSGAFISIANLADNQKGGLPNSPDFNSGTLRRIANSANVSGTINVVPGTEFSSPIYEITATGGTGDKTETTTFRLDPEKKREAFKNIGEASPNIQAFRPYLDRMRKFSTKDAKYWSTAYDGQSTNISNAGLGPSSFSNVKYYGVSANIVTDDEGNTNSIRLNIYDPVKKKLYEDVPWPDMLQPQQVAPALLSFDDAVIYKLVNGTTPTTGDLKLVQQASLKPY